MSSVIPPETHELLQRLVCGGPLDSNIAEEGVAALLTEVDAPARDSILGAIFHGLIIADSPTTVLVGALRAIAKPDGKDFFAKKYVATSDGRLPIIVSGGGKKGRKMINISTPAAIIAASAGIPIIKVGSSATSCITGSADLADHYGIEASTSEQDVRARLDHCNFAFVSADKEISNFMHIYEGRFFATSVTSVGLGILLCPYEGRGVAFGISHPNVVRSAELLREFGIRKAYIVSSTDDGFHFIDELLPWGQNRLATLEGYQIEVTAWHGDVEVPDDWVAKIDQRPTTTENANIVQATLRGDGTAQRIHEQIVLLNAGLLFELSGSASSLEDGAEMAIRQVRDQHAWNTFISLQSS